MIRARASESGQYFAVFALLHCLACRSGSDGGVDHALDAGLSLDASPTEDAGPGKMPASTRRILYVVFADESATETRHVLRSLDSLSNYCVVSEMRYSLLSPDGQYAWAFDSYSGDGRSVLFDLTGDAPREALEYPRGFHGSFSPDSKWFVVDGINVDATVAFPVGDPAAAIDANGFLHWLPDGGGFVYVDADGVMVRPFEEDMPGPPFRVLEGQGINPSDELIWLSPDGLKAVVGLKSPQEYHLVSFRPDTPSIRLPATTVGQLAWSPDSQKVAYLDGTVPKVYSVADGNDMVLPTTIDNAGLFLGWATNQILAFTDVRTVNSPPIRVLDTTADSPAYVALGGDLASPDVRWRSYVLSPAEQRIYFTFSNSFEGGWGSVEVDTSASPNGFTTGTVESHVAISVSPDGQRVVANKKSVIGAYLGYGDPDAQEAGLWHEFTDGIWPTNDEVVSWAPDSSGFILRPWTEGPELNGSLFYSDREGNIQRVTTDVTGSEYAGSITWSGGRYY